GTGVGRAREERSPRPEARPGPLRPRAPRRPLRRRVEGRALVARHCLAIPPVAGAGGTGRSAASLLLDDPTREGRLVVAPGISTRGAPPCSVRDYQTVPSGATPGRRSDPPPPAR